MAARSRRHETFLPQARNPFEDSGFSKEVIAALLANGDQSLVIALKGLQRSIARALHPDVARRSSPEGEELFNSIMSSTGLLLDDMSDTDRRTLGAAFTKKRGATPRSAREKVEYESKDIHDGTLLSQMIDMVVDSGESIASVKEKRLIVRPLDFSLDKPAGHTTTTSYDWYPPVSAMIPVFDVSKEGSVAWTSMRHTSLFYMLKKEHGAKMTQEEYREERDRLSLNFQRTINPVLAKRPLSGNMDTNQVLVDVDLGMMRIYDLEAQAPIATVQLDEALIEFGDGIYTFGAKDEGKSLGVLADGMYLPDKEVSEKNAQTSVLVLGSVDRDFVNLQREAIFDEPQKTRLRLPTKAKTGNEFSHFTIPENMYSHAQKYYSPLVKDRSFVVATDESRQLFILGETILVTNQ